MTCFRYILATVLCLIFSPNTGTCQSDSTSRTLHLLTINVWSGLDYEGSLKMGEYESKEIRKKRYRALVTQIKQLDPDIIALQETNKLPDYAERLAGDIGYQAFYHVGVGGVRLGRVGLPWNLREGDAILAKKNLQPEFAGRKQLSGGYVGNWATFHFSDATQIVAVKVTVLGRPLYVFVTHWHASLLGTAEILKKANRAVETGESSHEDYEEAMAEITQGVQRRLAESEKTLAFIQKTAQNHPFVLMGDFNADPGSREISNLVQAGLVDLFHAANPDSAGFTWDPQTNLNIRTYYLKNAGPLNQQSLLADLKKKHEATPKRIDFILLGPSTLLNAGELKINSSRVALDLIIDGVHASDHYGVFAKIEFNE